MMTDLSVFVYLVLLTVALVIVLLVRQGRLMDNTDALTAAVAKLQTDVDTLLAKPPASVQPAIDAATAAVDAIDAKVVAAIG